MGHPRPRIEGAALAVRTRALQAQSAQLRNILRRYAGQRNGTPTRKLEVDALTQDQNVESGCDQNVELDCPRIRQQLSDGISVLSTTKDGAGLEIAAHATHRLGLIRRAHVTLVSAAQFLFECDDAQPPIDCFTLRKLYVCYGQSLPIHCLYSTVHQYLGHNSA